MRKLCSTILYCLHRKSVLALAGISTAVIAISLLLNTIALSQTGALKIGDRLPYLTLSNTMNYDCENLQLSTLRGKLVIIDFWATWCSPCITSMPKTDSLQKAFADKVQFVAVTYQSQEEVRKLLSKMKQRNGFEPSFPFVTSDSVLHELFPHRELPHYVWVDADGVVKAITGYKDVTASRINAMLKYGDIRVAEKKDTYRKYNRRVPLMLADSVVDSDVINYGTVFTNYIPGLSGRYDLFTLPNGGKRMTITNMDLRRLSAFALGEQEHIGTNRIFAEVDEPSRVVPPGGAFDKAWKAANSYCYEIIVPAHLADSIYSMMRQDIARLFPQYDIKLEKRMRPCLALVRTSKENKFQSKGGKRQFSFDRFGATITNCPLKLLVTQLNLIDLQHLATPVVDATGYTGMADLRLPVTLSNVPDLRKALQAYDLDLVERDMMIKVVVIRDRK